METSLNYMDSYNVNSYKIAFLRNEYITYSSAPRRHFLILLLWIAWQYPHKNMFNALHLNVCLMNLEE